MFLKLNFWRVFFYIKGRYLQLLKKILIFKVSVKKKIKTLPRVRRAGAREKLPIFFKIELKKANRQQCAHF